MTRFRNFVVGCVVSVASIMTSLIPAQAVPIAVPDAKVGQTTDVQVVDHRRGHYYPRRDYRPREYRPRDYDRYYGDGYYGRRYYNPGFGVYIAPRPIYRERYVRPSYGGSHVDWCLSRYRSYNPATDRFLAYGGVYRICRSPYR